MEFMKVAVKEAVEGVEIGDGGPFGAVVVKDGKIVAGGHNKVLISNDPTAHAEVTAIRNACNKLGTFDLSGCVMYTSCYPCPMCFGAALWARLDAVYYAATPSDAASVGFDDAAFYEILRNPEQTKYKIERLEIDDFMKPFKIWDEKANKIPY